MSSILTNNGAMVALQTLKSINADLAKTQDMISTGKEVATAKDNSALWAISKVMESDVAGFKAISDSLSLGESTVAVASAGAEQIVEVLKDMKELAVSAQSENVDFAKIQADMDEMAAQVASVIGASQFNGANLLASDIDGNGATSLTVLSSLDRVGTGAPTATTISVDTVDFEADIDLAADLTAITDTATAATALGELETFLQTAIDGAAALGASAARLQDQNVFVGKLVDAMKSGIGTLVDANMEEASAKLQALQVQQQLGVQSLSIANQAPQTILSLFR
ncbi:flagellin [Ponticoccus sp. SC2-23]|uniref:flagellin N-terminal helical domain-containing protein n=1 Tax=Alexandriicola marinus TaxID=2081710 RepID=UPI000FD71292|nr:flagellin [Alexandriicola marinus]MBM1220502.1 flagellin [Ponticoccus sp. SC6-9]MBM1225188.1 flagellin [Ponticoccus sp. SC6-15]MBM1228702.1 flagellin [Ponticoccus sp. SC6-38]MBM1233661.1 flagellin [Ponticoccus sp. SC6-45]MBM1239203.1 flagellin [Ponticoccus sp. SC6-49]MBM1242985.1 flagellin [Ponticoccus sp. SC2-64]MBM1247185.1 flagellin [Ponticoccus sp. SC6-42]MBM1252156.1 flagellin [Ponticoccus sp. SC6-33]MBM1257212.1 flagellin [Ponticoccus sp. SC6-60]MBM1260674.1 flagellin [Ponticoccu